MSGSAVPYDIRPHKAVDRRIFVDLLRRIERWKSLSDYAYVSMGGYPLEDHRQIHRSLAISRLVSFDVDEKIVDRQQFNRPIASCGCLLRSSSDVVEDLDRVLEDGGVEDSSGVIVWLDYTAPRQLGFQIREFHTLLDSLAPGDVVRITLNANHQSLGAKTKDDGTPVSAEELKQHRFSVLKSRVGEYLPSDAEPDDITKVRYPELLSKIVGNVALMAFPATEETVVLPLSGVVYTDMHQMVSLTAIVLNRCEVDEFVECIDYANWEFSIDGWGPVCRLSVPHMTFRERLFFEQNMADDLLDKLENNLGFLFDGDGDVLKKVEEYKRFYRFYPSLVSADL